MLIVRIITILLIILGVVIMIHSSVVLLKNAKFAPLERFKTDPTPQTLVKSGLYKYI